MGETYSMLESEEECIQGFGGTARRKVTIRKTDVEEDDSKMDIREVGWSGVDWINLAQDRDRWRALVNTVMKYCSIKCWAILE
jgi:hypothetical protein